MRTPRSYWVELHGTGVLWHLDAVASAAPFRRKAGVAGKRAFAKRVRRFVKWTRALPGFPQLEIVCVALAALMTVTGGFHSSEIPTAPRALFWILLFGWNALKWQTWFALVVRKPRDWPRAGLIGAVLLNASLPIEIAIALALVGVSGGPGWWETWGRALLLSLIAAGAIAAFKRWARMRQVDTDSSPAASALLMRAGVAPDSLLAIEAEDHYCRVHRADGSNALIHYRFGDALGEIAHLDGMQVHRGAWVAARAVTGAVRDGRRWRLMLVDGGSLPVSATHLAAVRQRGWLRPCSTASCAASATMVEIGATSL